MFPLCKHTLGQNRGPGEHSHREPPALQIKEKAPRETEAGPSCLARVLLQLREEQRTNILQWQKMPAQICPLPAFLFSVPLTLFLSSLRQKPSVLERDSSLPKAPNQGLAIDSRGSDVLSTMGSLLWPLLLLLSFCSVLH